MKGKSVNAELTKLLKLQQVLIDETRYRGEAKLTALNGRPCVNVQVGTVLISVSNEYWLRREKKVRRSSALDDFYFMDLNEYFDTAEEVVKRILDLLIYNTNLCQEITLSTPSICVLGEP